MRDLARPGKADLLVVGEGLTALLLALEAGRAGRRVVLVREHGWPVPPGPAEWPAVSPMGGAERRALAQPGWSLLASLAEHLPGVHLGEIAWLEASDTSPQRVPAAWLDAGRLFPALAEEVKRAGVEVVRTTVRGISVIEGQVLGVVTEARRWDGRGMVIATEEAARAYALTRMAQDPQRVEEVTWPLRRLLREGEARASPTGIFWTAEGAAWLWGGLPGVQLSGPCLTDVPLSSPEHAPRVGPSARVKGLWYALGTRGWPLVAAGAAHFLAEKVLGR